MPQTELDLKRLRTEIIDYIHQARLPVFYGFGNPDEGDFTYWDNRSYPDWRQFVDVAKECGAKLLLFGSEDFSAEQLDEAFEKLEECDIDSDEQRSYMKQFEALRKHVGQTAWVRVAFEHGGRWLAYELTAPWRDEFESALEELEIFLPVDDLEDEEEENDSGRGFFSRN